MINGICSEKHESEPDDMNAKKASRVERAELSLELVQY
jgi:hypothetical protein